MYFPDESILPKQYPYVEARTNSDKGCHGFSSIGGRVMRTQEELGFRDFSSLFLVKENRKQLGHSACCISFIKVTLTSRVFAMDERSESGMQC
jgi:hypothetical protein